MDLCILTQNEIHYISLKEKNKLQTKYSTLYCKYIHICIYLYSVYNYTHSYSVYTTVHTEKFCKI